MTTDKKTIALTNKTEYCEDHNLKWEEEQRGLFPRKYSPVTCSCKRGWSKHWPLNEYRQMRVNCFKMLKRSSRGMYNVRLNR